VRRLILALLVMGGLSITGCVVIHFLESVKPWPYPPTTIPQDKW